MLPESSGIYLFSQQQKDMASQQWLTEAQKLASDVLQNHRGAWAALTELLLEKETADGEDVKNCMGKT